MSPLQLSQAATDLSLDGVSTRPLASPFPSWREEAKGKDTVLVYLGGSGLSLVSPTSHLPVLLTSGLAQEPELGHLRLISQLPQLHKVSSHNKSLFWATHCGFTPTNKPSMIQADSEFLPTLELLEL